MLPFIDTTSRPWTKPDDQTYLVEVALDIARRPQRHMTYPVHRDRCGWAHPVLKVGDQPGHWVDIAISSQPYAVGADLEWANLCVDDRVRFGAEGRGHCDGASRCEAQVRRMNMVEAVWVEIGCLARSYERAASRMEDGWDAGIPCSGFAPNRVQGTAGVSAVLR